MDYVDYVDSFGGKPIRALGCFATFLTGLFIFPKTFSRGFPALQLS